MPVYYIIAVIIMFASLFSLRYEISFLKNNKISLFGWIISILNFLIVFSLLVVLLLHRFLNEIYALFTIVTLLILLMIVSAIQLVTRRRMFKAMKEELMDQKLEMISDMHALIDEKKREKIRKKYSKDDQEHQSSNGTNNR